MATVFTASMLKHKAIIVDTTLTKMTLLTIGMLLLYNLNI